LKPAPSIPTFPVMENLLTYGYRHFRLVHVLVIVITVVSSTLLRDLEIDVSIDSVIGRQSEQWSNFLEVNETFGESEGFHIYIEDPELFSHEKLSILQGLHSQLLTIEGIQGIDSLFSISDVNIVDGSLVTEPILSRIPKQKAELEMKRVHALKNQIFADTLVGKNGSALAFCVHLAPELATNADLADLYQQVEGLLRKERPHFLHLFQIGTPATQTWMVMQLKQDMVWIFPLSVTLMVVILMIIMRSLSAGLLPVINALLAMNWTFGIMVLLGIPINLLNYVVPALVLIIGATEDVHVFHKYRKYLIVCKDGEMALRETGKRILLTLMLTFLTTVLGFAAATLSDLPILHHFALAATIGMIVRFLITLVFLPATLRLIHLQTENISGKRPLSLPFLRNLSDVIFNKLAPFSHYLLGAVVIFAVFFLFYGSKVELDNDLNSFIDSETEISQRKEMFESTFPGSGRMRLTFYGNKNDFLDPRNLELIQQTSEYLRDLPGIEKTIAFPDIIARIHQQFNDGNQDFHRIPESADAIEQMLLFAPANAMLPFINNDYSTASILLNTSLQKSRDINELVKTVEDEMESRRFGNFHFTLTGKNILTSSAVYSITKAQVHSIGGMSVLLLGIVAASFMSLRCGLVTIVSSLIPICFLFGLMRFLDINLNVATCMVAAVTMGLSIDDSLHLLVRFNQELKRLREERLAIKESLKLEAQPIVSTSLALAAGFAVLQLSSFGPIRDFGILCAFIILIALATHLIITPIFIQSIRVIALTDLLGLRLSKTSVASSPLFAGLSFWQCKQVVLSANIQEYALGEYLLRMGDSSDTMFVVLNGKIEVFKDTSLGSMLVADAQPGELFGELSLISRHKSRINIKAAVNSRVLAIDASWLKSIRLYSPNLASLVFLNISRIISTRISSSYQFSI